ncbi:MAG: hypothetical protein RI894_1306 [Bacteroidota bacterium]|jgi:outer membrane protein OmpA-like peptidoglycan-associated protein
MPFTLFAQTIDPNVFYKLKAAHSGKFISVAGNGYREYSPVVQWDSPIACEDGQAYKFTKVGEFYKIEVRNKNGMFLTSLNIFDGAKIVMARFTGSDNQLWKPTKVGDYYKIECKSTGKVLDVSNMGMNNGEMLQLWQYSQQANQHWQLSPAQEEDPVWENLGANINTVRTETAPCFSVDGKLMYYTIGIATQIGVTSGDIYQSELQADGKWSLGKLVPELSNFLHNAVFGIFPGGNKLLLFGDYTGGNALYSIASKTANGWGAPEPVVVRTPLITQRIWGGSVGSDGKTILMELITNQIRFDADIYVSFQKPSGEWTDALNLGPIINKVGFFDGSPYLAPDMKTLYFSSSRDGGRATHFYMAKRLDDTWQNWSEPIRMGEGMYKEAGVQYYNVPGDGEYAYFVSGTKTYGESDILRVKLKKEEKPEPFMVVNGKTLDKKTNKPISATITFEDITTKEVMGTTVSDPRTGAYQIALPKGKNYGIYAIAKQYYSINDNIDLTNLETYKVLNKDCFLVPLAVGETIKLNNVFFERKMSVVKSESYSELDRLVDIMKANPTMEIELQGHTENLGDPVKNQVLSEQRVAATKKYLVEKGITEKRIKGKGFGGTKPVGQGTTAEAQKLNRRVEFMILKN